MSNKPPKEYREPSRRQLKKAAKKVCVDPWIHVGRTLSERSRRGRGCVRRSWIDRAGLGVLRMILTTENKCQIVFARPPSYYDVIGGLKCSNCTVKQLDACKNYDDFIKLVETEIAITRLMQ